VHQQRAPALFTAARHRVAAMHQPATEIRTDG